MSLNTMEAVTVSTAIRFSVLLLFFSHTNMFLIPIFSSPLYEGANYFLLGRILYYVLSNSSLHPGRVVSTFLGIDLTIVALTAVGGRCVSNSSFSQSDINLGKNLLKAALLLQIASMCTFVAITARYHYRCYKTGTLPSNLRPVLIVLYISCTLITVCTIYRTVEYIEAASLNVYSDLLHISPLLKHEVYFWVFEAMFMFLNTVLLNTFHPSRFLPVNNKIYLTQDCVRETEGPGYEDKRHFLLSLFDPFDIGIITKRDEKEMFWEKDSMKRTSRPEAFTPLYV
ncbi:putative RTA1 domain protein [Armillaria fumosa]|nr:putative RTA1 domain protein [Armillaria fumosa]